jgi:hypothetical protein
MLLHVLFWDLVLMEGRPISTYWTFSFVPQRCLDERIHLLLQGTLNILFDSCVVLIPIPIVVISARLASINVESFHIFFVCFEQKES